MSNFSIAKYRNHEDTDMVAENLSLEDVVDFFRYVSENDRYNYSITQWDTSLVTGQPEILEQMNAEDFLSELTKTAA